ncbi:unnamed protein product [Sphagnum jensenii]|uniref:Uncharacterized protein n=1 Tax=Sphagnum jensenii TaxID=128206 RepID=A0ABP1AES3_9BRYO
MDNHSRSRSNWKPDGFMSARCIKRIVFTNRMAAQEIMFAAPTRSYEARMMFKGNCGSSVQQLSRHRLCNARCRRGRSSFSTLNYFQELQECRVDQGRTTMTSTTELETLHNIRM